VLTSSDLGFWSIPAFLPVNESFRGIDKIPLTSLDGLLEITVLVNGDRTPLEPLMLYQTSEKTVGIVDFARDQRFELEWELANGWHRRPMGWPEEYYDRSLLVQKYVNEKYIGTELRLNGTSGTCTFGTRVQVDRCQGHIKLEFWRPDKESVVKETGITAMLHTFILLYRTDKHGQDCVDCHCPVFVDEMARADRHGLEQRERQAAEQRERDVADQRAQRELEVAQGLNERERLLRQRELAVEQRERELERRERDIVHAAPNPVDEDRKPVILEVQDSGSESRLEGRLAKVEQELASLRSMVSQRESRGRSPSESPVRRKRPRRKVGSLNITL
jgi:hypothetical protein